MKNRGTGRWLLTMLLASALVCGQGHTRGVKDDRAQPSPVAPTELTAAGESAGEGGAELLEVDRSDLEELLALNEHLRTECAALDRELSALERDQWMKLLLASLVGVATGTLCGVTIYFVTGG